MRYSILLLAFSASPALGQPAPPPPNYAPNFFNRAQQPLSPYLNLLRGSNPATNYYYGVRPGLPSGGMNTFGQSPNIPQFQPQTGPMYGGFLPQSQTPYDPNAQSYEPGGQPIRLNSASHPVLFGNQFANHGSYFNVYAQNINRSGFTGGQQGPMQSVQGLGNVNRARPAAPAAGQRKPPTINAYP